MMIPRSFTLRFGAPRYPATSIYSSSRTFSSFTARLAKSKPKTSAPAPSPVPRTPFSNSKASVDYRFMGRRPEGFVAFERKVLRDKSVLLFEAPSQRSYILGAYSFSAFCFAYAVINSTVKIGSEAPAWVKGCYVVVCVVMSALGTVLIGKTGRLVQKITAVKSTDGVKLLVDVRPYIPFRKSYTLTTTPRQIAFSRQLAVDPSRTTPDGRLRSLPPSPSFSKNPLNTISYNMFKFFRSCRRIFTQEDFALVELEGQKGAYRMDSNGYISNDLFAIGSRLMR